MKAFPASNVEFLTEPETLADIWLAIYHCRVEISGLARVSKVDDNSYLIGGEPEIFEQTCSYASTDFEIKTYHDWIHKKAKAGNLDFLSEMRLWWHSHVWGHAYFSSTDENTIKSFGASGTEYWVSLVLNKHGEWLMWINYRNDWNHPLRITSLRFTRDVSAEKMRQIMIERSEKIKKIVDEKVSIQSVSEEPFERIISGFFHRKKDFWD